MKELKNKKINTIIDNLLEKTLSGKINWERSDSINYRNGVYYWKWETEKYGRISINASHNVTGEDIIYFDIFNVNGVHIIENQYLVSENSNIIKLYNHIQKEYDEKGAELIEKLLEELNNL